MAFDMEFAADAIVVKTQPSLAKAFAAEPEPDWAQSNPDRLLAFLYVSPRPCAALDALLGL